jgi:hypothetical protein
MGKSVITSGQIKKIHTLVSKMGYKDEWYRDKLQSLYKVGSSKKLTEFQAECFIEKLEDEAVETGVWVRHGCGNRPGMATDKQLKKIRAMWFYVCNSGNPKERDSQLRTLLENKAKVSDLRFVTKIKANTIITILEDMTIRKKKKELEEKINA